MSVELQILLNYGALGAVTYVLLRFILKTLHDALSDLGDQHERIIEHSERHGEALDEIVKALKNMNGNSGPHGPEGGRR